MPAIRDVTSDLCLVRDERRGERREEIYKVTAGCGTSPKNLCERNMWVIY